MNKMPIILVVCLLLGSALIVHFLKGSSLQNQITDADASYQQGETATSLPERETAFNHALNLYLDMEKKNTPEYSSGKLFYNIGNTYFQLEQYPQAILYYNRALNLRPGDSRITHNLSVALKNLSLSPELPSSWPSYLTLSLPQKLQFFAWLSIAALTLLSMLIWKPLPFLRTTATFCITLATIFLLSALYSRFFTPLEGILIQSSTLYRDAGKQYAKVQEKPLPQGSKVEILRETQEGAWLWISTPDGIQGFIPSDSLRVI